MVFGLRRCRLGAASPSLPVALLLAACYGKVAADAEPPGVRAVERTPAPGSWVEQVDAVRLRLPGPLDPTAARPGALSLRSADGAVLAATLRATTDELTLTPEAVLPEGRYLVEVASDLAYTDGTAVARAPWSFEVRTVRTAWSQPVPLGGGARRDLTVVSSPLGVATAVWHDGAGEVHAAAFTEGGWSPAVPVFDRLDSPPELTAAAVGGKALIAVAAARRHPVTGFFEGVDVSLHHPGERGWAAEFAPILPAARLCGLRLAADGSQALWMAYAIERGSTAEVWRAVRRGSQDWTHERLAIGETADVERMAASTAGHVLLVSRVHERGTSRVHLHVRVPGRGWTDAATATADAVLDAGVTETGDAWVLLLRDLAHARLLRRVAGEWRTAVDLDVPIAHAVAPDLSLLSLTVRGTAGRMQLQAVEVPAARSARVTVLSDDLAGSPFVWLLGDPGRRVRVAYLERDELLYRELDPSGAWSRPASWHRDEAQVPIERASVSRAGPWRTFLCWRGADGREQVTAFAPGEPIGLPTANPFAGIGSVLLRHATATGELHLIGEDGGGLVAQLVR